MGIVAALPIAEEPRHFRVGWEDQPTQETGGARAAAGSRERAGSGELKGPRRGGLGVTLDWTAGAAGGHSGAVAETAELRAGWKARKWRLKFGETERKLCGRTNVSPVHVKIS